MPVRVKLDTINHDIDDIEQNVAIRPLLKLPFNFKGNAQKLVTTQK